MVKITRSVVERYETCLRNNPKTQNKIQLGSTKPRNTPGEHWQIDFTELPRKGGLRYLLVLVDTFTG